MVPVGTVSGLSINETPEQTLYSLLDTTGVGLTGTVNLKLFPEHPSAEGLIVYSAELTIKLVMVST